MKHRLFTGVLAALLCTGILGRGSDATENTQPFDVDARSAILMDAKTGTVLYEKNADEALPPASVTKVMTLLLIMEAIDGGRLALSDTVSVSEYAASMGGSQVYLKPGEEMTVDDLLKSVVVASANDAAVALAERIAGSEEAFVSQMNERAAALGMQNTTFENVTGLDDDTVHHLTSARDIALMSRELLRHETILNYSTIWMDSIRDGAFGLSNTNRLIRFYSGATGLKTGSTSKAKFCISATARRDGLHLIAVIMGSPTRDIRNDMAKKLLDWGFAGYALYCSPASSMEEIPLFGGIANTCSIAHPEFTALVKKGSEKNITVTPVLPESLRAPIASGDVVGQMEYRLGDTLIGVTDITATEDIPALGFGELFKRLWRAALLGG